jgi:hypothetical protein
MQEGGISREANAPQLGHLAFISSLHISTSASHCRHFKSSGVGWRIVRLPGQKRLPISITQTSVVLTIL